MSATVDEAYFEIHYDRNSTEILAADAFNPILPTRAPDFIMQRGAYFTKDAIPISSIHFWFPEGRCASIYMEDNKPEPRPGACNLCPNTGHIMYIYEGQENWQYGSKAAQDAFVNWVTDKSLIQD